MASQPPSQPPSHQPPPGVDQQLFNQVKLLLFNKFNTATVSANAAVKCAVEQLQADQQCLDQWRCPLLVKTGRFKGSQCPGAKMTPAKMIPDPEDTTGINKISVCETCYDNWIKQEQRRRKKEKGSEFSFSPFFISFRKS